MTSSLPDTFAPPSTRHERARRGGQQGPEVLELAVQQQSRRRVGDVGDDAGGRGVGAVRRAERVVDVDVGQRRQRRPREVCVVRLLLGVGSAGSRAGSRRRARRRPSPPRRRLADAVGGEAHRPAEQRRQP